MGGREGRRDRGKQKKRMQEGKDRRRVRNMEPVLFAAVAESSSGHEVWYL